MGPATRARRAPGESGWGRGVAHALGLRGRPGTRSAAAGTGAGEDRCEPAADDREARARQPTGRGGTCPRGPGTVMPLTSTALSGRTKSRGTPDARRPPVAGFDGLLTAARGPCQEGVKSAWKHVSTASRCVVPGRNESQTERCGVRTTVRGVTLEDE